MTHQTFHHQLHVTQNFKRHVLYMLHTVLHKSKQRKNLMILLLSLFLLLHQTLKHFVTFQQPFVLKFAMLPLAALSLRQRRAVLLAMRSRVRNFPIVLPFMTKRLELSSYPTLMLLSMHSYLTSIIVFILYRYNIHFCKLNSIS